MPFEISPKKQSAAEQLAALIEAGRAANPTMRHCPGWGDGVHSGCAMTFAMKAAGLRVRDLDGLARTLGISDGEMTNLAAAVIRANDEARASLEDVAAALRTNVWPEAKTYAYIKPMGPIIWVSSDVIADLYNEPVKWTVDYIGDPTKFDGDILKPKADAKPQPAKKVRTSAKTGASWPTPKHCYA